MKLPRVSNCKSLISADQKVNGREFITASICITNVVNSPKLKTENFVTFVDSLNDLHI